VNEKTLDKLRQSGILDADKIARAALRLCEKLRKEIGDSKLLNKSYDFKSRPNQVKTNENSGAYTSAYTNKYRSPCNLLFIFINFCFLIFVLLQVFKFKLILNQPEQ